MRDSNLHLIAFIAFSYILSVNGQLENNNTATWCTVSKAEQDKCMAFSRAIDLEVAAFRNDYISLSCKLAFNKEECMTLLDQEKVQLTTLDPGEVFIGGRYHSLIPIMQELYDSRVNYQYAVAVVKKGSLGDVTSLNDLRGKKACFAGVGTLAGWVIPVRTLMKHGGMEVIDCNNHVKSTTKFFGPSCAVNSLIDKYNPLGDNSNRLCELCIGKIPSDRCTNADPYSGYEGAFRCLVEAGEIAFLVHTTVPELTSTNLEFHNMKKDEFELLCRDGTRRPIDDYKFCNWGEAPSRAIVTSSVTNLEKRKMLQKFLQTADRLFNKRSLNNTSDDNRFNRFNNEGNDNFGRNYDNREEYENNREEYENNREEYDKSFDGGSNGINSYNTNSNDTFSYYNPQNPDDESTRVRPIEVFDIFESVPRYGRHHNLLFSDASKAFLSLPERNQTYSGYLGRALDSILAVRHCPVDRMVLCVTSEPEMEKCVKMKIALKAQLLKPELICHKGHSQIHCMHAIQTGTADVTILDASDVYTAGLRFGLIPFISEVYNLGTPDYYVVAVAKEADENTDLTYLKNKYTCHPGINTAAGWVYPLAYLISNGWIRSYGCDSVRAAAEYFMKSCVPGALSTEYNTGLPYDNMCDLCHGVSSRYCRRDASEDYFGQTGAFRCLVEGGGDVAFVRHTTVAENTDGKKREFWARNAFTKDFQLLCPDGTRRATSDFMRCNLGKVAANAIVTRGGYYGYNETEINAYINLFIYAQQFYGRKELDEFSFSMFYSVPPYSDLIFQDATQQLIVIPPEKRQFSAYLGPDFMRARRVVDCNAGASAIEYSLLGSLALVIITFVFSKR